MNFLPTYIRVWLMVTTVLSSVSVFAQSENPYKSRLEIKPKQKTATVSALRKSTFTHFQPIHNTLDRGINLHRAAAINQYFSSSFLQKNTKTVAKAESLVTTANIPDGFRAEELLSTEDKLFANDKLLVSNIYPNPADEYAYLDYSVSAQVNEVKVTFYNIFGSEIKEETLDKDQRKLRVSIKDWPNGIYLYQLSADGKSLVTKKLLVRHQ